MESKAQIKTISIIIISLIILTFFLFSFNNFGAGKELPKEIGQKTITYTAGSDTTCNNGVCNKILYSGIRNVQEDGQWKRVENAKSLKDKGFNIVYLENDEEFPIEVIDFNLTSITVDLKKSGKQLNKDIPIRIWKLNESKKLTGDYKQDYKKVREETESFHLFSFDKRRTYEFSLGSILEFGFNSTTIKLQDNGTENLEDANFDEDGSRDGSESWILVDLLDGNGEIGFLKFNISGIPENQVIENATLCLYTYIGSDQDLQVWRTDNQTWVESQIDDFCGDGVYCSDLDSFFTTLLRTYNGVNGVGVWECISDLHTDGVIVDYNAGNPATSFVLNFTGSDGVYGFRSKEFSNVTIRPYLNITYSEVVDNSPTYSNNNHNYTVAGQSIKFSILYDDDTALETAGQYIFSTNNTGIWVNESAVNFTATPSWANVTKTLNSTIGVLVGYRWYADDNSGNVNNTRIFSLLTSSDTTAPTINVFSPTNTTYSSSTIYFNATADETISSWIVNYNGTNHTVTINTTLEVEDGFHHLLFYGNDSSNNFGLNDSVYFTIDTVLPYFTDYTNQTAQSNASFSYDINATDTTSSIHKYWIDDTTNFTINADTGVITNATTMSVYNYKINISVNDTSGNLNWTLFGYNVTAIPGDTTSPYFTTIPLNTTITYKEGFGVDFDATDETGFGNYSINWTTLFKINQSGYLENSTSNIPVGIYLINVTINDTSNNLNSTIYNVTVNKDSTSCGVLINVTSPQTYNEIIRVSTNCTSAYNLYRNGTSIVNGSSLDLSAGTYNFTVIRTDQTNYSNVYEEKTFKVNQISGVVFTYLNNTRANLSIVQNNMAYLNATLNTGVGDIKIYYNDSQINTGTSPLFNYTNFTNIGTFNVTAFYEGNINYSSSFETWFVNVTSTIADTTKPTIILTSPEDNSADTDGVIRFTFTSIDSNQINNCSLIYSGNQIYTTSHSISNGTNIIEVVGITNLHPLWLDNLQWSINCTDEYSNTGSSVTFHLDAKDDTSSSGGGSGTTTLQNPRNINLFYQKIWIPGTNQEIIIESFNTNNQIYKPKNVTINFDIEGLTLKSISLLEDKSIALFKIEQNTKPGDYKINVTVTDEKTLKSEIEFSIKEKEKITKISDKVKENIGILILGILILTVLCTIISLILLDKKRS